MDEIEILINKIRDLQLSDASNHNNVGMFVSQRSNRFLGYKRNDNNIYFPALIAFTLLPLKNHFTADQNAILKQIIDGVRKNYRNYSGGENNSLYNFYQTQPNLHYPNGYFFSKFKHFKLAEDADDTAIIYMTLDTSDLQRIDLVVIRKQLVKFSNLNQKRISSTLSKYRNFKAYGVWLGSGKMPVEFDLCVMANVLCFAFKNNCEPNEHDIASLNYIRTAIIDNDIEMHPFEISYTYPNTVIMLYHIGRLWSYIPNPENYLPKATIIDKLNKYLLDTNSIIEKLLLTTSLIRMGETPTVVKYQLEALEKEFNGFGFFKAPMLKGTTNPIINYLSKFELFHLLFDCNAYYYALALEYEVLIRQAEKAEV